MHLVTTAAALSVYSDIYIGIYIYIKRATTPQVQSQFCPNESYFRIHLGMTGDELHDGAERGPVDRDGARSTKSKHSTSLIRGLRVSPGRFVGLYRSLPLRVTST